MLVVKARMSLFVINLVEVEGHSALEGRLCTIGKYDSTFNVGMGQVQNGLL